MSKVLNDGNYISYADYKLALLKSNNYKSPYDLIKNRAIFSLKTGALLDTFRPFTSYWPFIIMAFMVFMGYLNYKQLLSFLESHGPNWELPLLFFVIPFVSIFIGLGWYLYKRKNLTNDKCPSIDIVVNNSNDPELLRALYLPLSLFSEDGSLKPYFNLYGQKTIGEDVPVEIWHRNRTALFVFEDPNQHYCGSDYKYLKADNIFFNFDIFLDSVRSNKSSNFHWDYYSSFHFPELDTEEYLLLEYKKIRETIVPKEILNTINGNTIEKKSLVAERYITRSLIRHNSNEELAQFLNDFYANNEFLKPFNAECSIGLLLSMNAFVIENNLFDKKPSHIRKKYVAHAEQLNDELKIKGEISTVALSIKSMINTKDIDNVSDFNKVIKHLMKKTPESLMNGTLTHIIILVKLIESELERDHIDNKSA